MHIHTLNLRGSARRSRTLTDNPISVAMEQCGIVGVNWTSTLFFTSSTWWRLYTASVGADRRVDTTSRGAEVRALVREYRTEISVCRIVCMLKYHIMPELRVTPVVRERRMNQKEIWRAHCNKAHTKRKVRKDAGRTDLDVLESEYTQFFERVGVLGV
jgi:hypothetical protein